MGKSNKVCPSCGRKMKQQFIGLQHCKCGVSWKKDIGFFEKDNTIQLFRENTYHEGTVLISAMGITFEGRVFQMSDNERQFRFSSKEELTNLYSEASLEGRVISVTPIKEKTYAPALFSQTDLQREANRLYQIKPDKTLEICQQLYEKSYCQTHAQVRCI